MLSYRQPGQSGISYLNLEQFKPLYNFNLSMGFYHDFFQNQIFLKKYNILIGI